MAELRSSALGDTRTKNWIGWGSRRRLFYTRVDTRLKPVVIPTDVIKQSTIIALAPRWVDGNHNLHDWLGRDGSKSPANKLRKQRKEKDTIHQDEGPRSTGVFGTIESVKGRAREEEEVQGSE
ncbi:unnamed protein product [Nippostrongylus brasiliensis]|uniref:Reverse transcriptase n=1 Tax=Nippostrongylus brasiliensis TaxID=27835 RepID=A0A0N4YIZ3_NIPBR|nr:unnamed protein product [Nippostrongylus brasiliensis]